VSPAGAALGTPLTDVERQIYFVEDGFDPSPAAAAYIRARGADRMSSYGDWAAVSDICDADVARVLKHEVSDGIIAPGYTDEAIEILKTKKKGNYNIVEDRPHLRSGRESSRRTSSASPSSRAITSTRSRADQLQNVVTSKQGHPRRC
jgi:phosphoribosylaminoimidazolecarboxamide formyltransferase/IMP cyclohydrolase